jgi:hypothetical protein
LNANCLHSRSACLLYSTKTVNFNAYFPSLFHAPPNLRLPCFNSLYFSLFFPFDFILFCSFSFPSLISTLIPPALSFPYVCFNVRCLFICHSPCSLFAVFISPFLIPSRTHFLLLWSLPQCQTLFFHNISNRYGDRC